MITQNIKIGKHTFLCRLFNNAELEYVVKKQYSMLRNVNIVSGIAEDKSIYIFEKEILDSIIENPNNRNIIYPINDSKERFSTDILDFTDLTNIKSYDFYQVQNTDNNISIVNKNIKCDKLEIYHPLTKVNNNDLIVCITTYIDDLTVYLFCGLYESCKNNSKEVINIYNDSYSEYIEIFIPNLNDLFSNNTYFIDDLNTCNIGKYNDSKIDIFKSDLIYEYNGNSLISTYLFSVPYMFYSDKNFINNKVYLPDLNNYSYGMSFPINVLLYPFNINDSSIIVSSEYLPNSESFVDSPKLLLSANLEFNDIGKLSVKGNFIIGDNETDDIKTLYALYNNVNLADYDNIYYEDKLEYEESGDDVEKTQLGYKQYQLMYTLVLASDPEFKNIIYKTPQKEYTRGGSLSNELMNAYYDIPIFNSWDKFPELLVCKIIFTDRYLGLRLESNFVVITKEYYKYLVLEDNTDNINSVKYKINLNEMSEKVNFYKNIVCTVKPEIKRTEITTSNNTKIIYKPIFYKVQNLQNIEIYTGVTQNIGINLANYMSKVKTFFLNIDGKSFIETARNDMYVIFNVQANLLSSQSGKYFVSNEENEFISSGNYILI